MIIVWDVYPNYNGPFVYHARAEVSEDVGERLLSIVRVLNRNNQSDNEYKGRMRFGAEEVHIGHNTADLVLDLLRAMGARKNGSDFISTDDWHRPGTKT